MLNRRQRSRGKIILHARRRDIDLEAVWEDDDRRPKLGVRLDAGATARGETLGEGDAVPFDNDIDIEVVEAQQEITDEAADGKDGNLQIIRNFTTLFQDILHLGAELFSQQTLHMPALKPSPVGRRF